MSPLEFRHSSSRRGGRYAVPLLTIVTLGMFCAASAWLGATTPRDVPDTSGYTNFDFQFPALLAQARTLGYPLYLELHERLTGSHRWVCWGHTFLFAAAALFFSASLPVSPHSRLAVLIGLMGTNIYWLYADTIATDTPAAAMGLVAIGFTVRFADRRTLGIAAGVCLSASAAWLIRPAMLAIVPASILISIVATRESGRREFISRIALLGGLLCAPVLLFCLLRLATVGKFGIVSFGGYNLIGVVGQFPSADSAPLASDEAQQIRERVRALKVDDPPALGELPPMNYTRLELNYDRTIWHWYVPAAQNVVGDDPAKI
ncbi:MAG: hypothetical protein JNG89_00895, partial [Planctomycetaceae bacterium]|nr:hypothetical protein [Planctomycetaceae bacterium]